MCVYLKQDCVYLNKKEIFKNKIREYIKQNINLNDLFTAGYVFFSALVASS